MKRIDYYDDFKERFAIKTLKETSVNNDGNKCSYMTDCTKKVVDFDQAKTNYCNRLGLSNEYASSADALCEISGNKLLLIEFKDGDFENKHIETKAKDSAFILSGILDESVNFIRNNIIFILVYNRENKRISDRDKRAITLANKGHEDFSLFGLSKIRGLYYNQVYVMDKKYFNRSSYLKNIVSL